MKSNHDKLAFRQSAEKAARPIALALTLTVGGGSLAACALVESKPVPTATAPAPEATPTTTETSPSNRYEGTDFERTDPLPENLVELHQMSPEQFAGQSKADQLRWASWADQYKEDFINMYYGVTGDSYDTPYELSPASDVLTAIEDVSYRDRIAANFGSANPGEDRLFNGPLDTNLIRKYITARVSSDPYSQWRIDAYMDSVGQDGQAINLAGQARAGLYDYRQNAEEASDFVAEPSQINVDGMAYNGWHVSYTADEGVKGDFTVAIIPFTNYLGEQDYTTITK